jgi:hypothetical protein
VPPRPGHDPVQLGARDRRAGGAALGCVLGLVSRGSCSLQACPSGNARTRCNRRKGCATTAQPPLQRLESRWRFTFIENQRADRSLCDFFGVSSTSAAGRSFVNDCLQVVLAMQKGSNSRGLQADAEYMAKAGLEAGASLLLLRGGARCIIGPACSPSTREAIQALCVQQGWKITIDLFAANCNKLVEHFASWTDEPDSDVVDAFTIRCERFHREKAFVFPPIGLERTVVRRAQSDGVKVVFVVPTAYKAGYWMALRNHSVAMTEWNDIASNFVGVQAPLGRHTIFLVDFGGPDTQSPPCGQESRHRGRRTLLSAVEEEQRRRIRSEIETADARGEADQASGAVIPRPDSDGI